MFTICIVSFLHTTYCENSEDFQDAYQVPGVVSEGFGGRISISVKIFQSFEPCSTSDFVYRGSVNAKKKKKKKIFLLNSDCIWWHGIFSDILRNPPGGLLRLVKNPQEFLARYYAHTGTWVYTYALTVGVSGRRVFFFFYISFFFFS